MSTNDNAGCLAAIFKLMTGLSIWRDQPAAPPYRRKDYLLTKAERAFFSVLTQAGADHLIFVKVRLLDLVWLPKGTSNRMTWLNKVKAKHVDFLLCARTDLRPLLVIELDDSSHQQSWRQERDAFVDRALAAAELPILHVPVRAKYDVNELQAQIRAKLNPSAN